jgi:hypothetical protein
MAKKPTQSGFVTQAKKPRVNYKKLIFQGLTQPGAKYPRYPRGSRGGGGS